MSFSVALGESRGFDCDAQRSVLDAMMSRGRSGITVGCRGGGCGVCKVRVVRGRYRTGVMSAACVSAAEREADVALACKLFPDSDLVLEVLGGIGRVLSRQGSSAFFDHYRTAAKRGADSFKEI